jgi:putative SOS response-associated peptidase YedK
MCGRFVGFSSLDEIVSRFSIDGSFPEAVRASYNVAPSQQVLTVVEEDGKRGLSFMHWGLVPFWAKDPSIGNRMINARSETVEQKPAFKSAFRRRRCLIVNDGFYEWTGAKGHRKPVFIRPRDRHGPFAFAGLWELWRPENDPGAAPYRSCTILTTEAADSIRPIHHRMPIVLSPEGYRTWLDPACADVGALRRLLQKEICRAFEHRPVSMKVNSPSNNEPSLIHAAGGSDP